MKPSFCHLFRRFSVTIEPHCALKAAKHLFKNNGYYHHNAIDRFGLNILLLRLFYDAKIDRFNHMKKNFEARCMKCHLLCMKRKKASQTHGSATGIPLVITSKSRG